MKQYVCSICSYTYDESKGIPEAGIPPGTPWEELPDDWTCPMCGAVKDMFVEKSAPPQPAAVEKSSRLMAEDLCREAGFMLPQSANTKAFLESIRDYPGIPRETVELLLASIPFHSA